MWVRDLVERAGVSWILSTAAAAVGGGGAYGGGRWNVEVAVGVTAMAGLALAATLVISSRRGTLKSPWSRRKRKHVLSQHQWKSLFTSEGKFRDGGVKFLKKVRSGGIDPNIRAEVWPFLLGVYDLNSTDAERKEIGKQKRKEYEKLRKRCRRILKHMDEGDKVMKAIDEVSSVDSPSCNDVLESPASEVFTEQGRPDIYIADHPVHDETSSSKTRNLNKEEENGNIRDDASFEEEKSEVTHVDAPPVNSASSDTESSSEEVESMSVPSAEGDMENDSNNDKVSSLKEDIPNSRQIKEDFSTWQRIIRLDAIRANAEWINYSPVQAEVSEDKALEAAASVGLKDFEHLEPCRIYHASRLVAVLEAYALYDAEIGYCQGMSDLLSPILAVMEEDYEAFWCFVGFMKKARHNFRLDEVGIRRQLSIVSKIIKSKDSHLYRHLEKLQAEDCFFVYRMVVVLFRRELDFDQTLCLWEVMWADQAAIRAGISKSAWGRTRSRAPPTEDLLLYAIAACVLQRRKLIIESYSSMDEIIRECNSMAGRLDVWKLLDDAHDLVVTLHDKI
ncbi:GTPase-activating protein GYP7-like [Iris pallida]|uniref:GTPase-activating protein GYP7-like n=1 Tax=Iris pallida TaxID=29817 RepID=A0AAX6GY20_IRIPA|nr:GTPase-activating protein GYP7-like [Iris pallida]